jgi:hypothetical protein
MYEVGRRDAKADMAAWWARVTAVVRGPDLAGIGERRWGQAAGQHPAILGRRLPRPPGTAARTRTRDGGTCMKGRSTKPDPLAVTAGSDRAPADPNAHPCGAGGICRVPGRLD